VPAGTSGSFCGRTGCSFNGEVATATPATALVRPPAPSLVSRPQRNQTMAFSCSTSVGLVCTYPKCPDAYQYPTDDTKTHSCSGNSNYKVTSCP